MPHFFCSDTDYAQLIQYIRNQGLVVSKQDEKRVDEDAFSCHEIRFYADQQGNDQSYILLAPPDNEMNSAGMLKISDDQNRELSCIYRRTNRYIKATFLSESGYYIGRDLYQKWYARQIHMDKMFLRAKHIKCFMQEKELQELITLLNGKGYETANKSIRKAAIFADRKHQRIIIYPKEARLFSYQTCAVIVGVGTFYGEEYNTESEAVFAFFDYSKKGIQCKFVIDERNYDQNKRLFELFTEIKAYVDHLPHERQGDG